VTAPQLQAGSPQAPFFDVARVLQSSRQFDDEIIVDLFAGGGGASTGIELALGRSPDIAINHDPEAVSLHQANHPRTTHYVSDIFDVDPLVACGGFPIGLLWASPDCKHFSKAKGGKPVSKKIRSLAWVVVKWARMPIQVRPRVICLENVEEFQTWGPLGADDRPCPLRKGRTFKRWKRSLEQLGYTSNTASCARATTARRRSASACSSSPAAMGICRSCGPSPPMEHLTRCPCAPAS
jgi:site-specific DNA-cytosine methylase